MEYRCEQRRRRDEVYQSLLRAKLLQSRHPRAHAVFCPARHRGRRRDHARLHSFATSRKALHLRRVQLSRHHAMKLSWLSPKTAVQPSAIEGRGLFAIDAIEKGEVVAVKGGHIIDRAMLAQ